MVLLLQLVSSKSRLLEQRDKRHRPRAAITLIASLPSLLRPMACAPTNSEIASGFITRIRRILELRLRSSCRVIGRGCVLPDGMCGCIVFGHDHQGHGKTTGTRVQVNSMDEYVDPVLAHVEFMKSKYPGLPCFIVGHSMGGLITLNALIKNQKLFNGAVLFGPLVMADPDMATPFRVFLAKSIQGVWPSFSLSEIDASLLTRDKEMVERIRKDSLNWHGGFKARHSWVLLQAFTFVQNNMARLTLPILVLQGGKDKVVDPAGAKMIIDNCSSEDKEYVEYPDAFHNLLVELDVVKSDVVDKIQAFINNHL